jgi:hypothetical protein
VIVYMLSNGALARGLGYWVSAIVCSSRYEACPAGYECSVIVCVVSNGALMTELGCEFPAIVCSSGQEACPCGYCHRLSMMVLGVD